MNMITKPISQMIGLAWALGMTIGALYFFWPQAYAVTAYHSGFLPMTEKVKEVSPEVWFKYQENLLSNAEVTLTALRGRLSNNNSTIDKKSGEYRKQERASQALLDKATALYQKAPDASSFTFIGKEYTPASFSTQVVVLKSQLDGARESLRLLEQAKEKLSAAWIDVAKKDAQISADLSRVATARVLWDTQKLLSDLEISVDFDDLSTMSEHDIRTVEELIKDSERLPMQPSATDTSAAGGMSDEALKILLNAS